MAAPESVNGTVEAETPAAQAMLVEQLTRQLGRLVVVHENIMRQTCYGGWTAESLTSEAETQSGSFSSIFSPAQTSDIARGGVGRVWPPFPGTTPPPPGIEHTIELSVLTECGGPWRTLRLEADPEILC